MRPVVPDVEVPRVRVAEVDDAAPVVVELHLDEVEGHLAVEHLVHRGVGVDALRRSGEELLAASGAVHQLAQLVGEGNHVLRRGLEVEVEAVHHGLAEGPVLGVRVGAE